MIDNKIKKGLGRGLSSLLGDSSQKVETNKIPIQDILLSITKLRYPLYLPVLKTPRQSLCKPYFQNTACHKLTRDYHAMELRKA